MRNTLILHGRIPVASNAYRYFNISPIIIDLLAVRTYTPVRFPPYSFGHSRYRYGFVEFGERSAAMHALPPAPPLRPLALLSPFLPPSPRFLSVALREISQSGGGIWWIASCFPLFSPHFSCMFIILADPNPAPKGKLTPSPWCHPVKMHLC